MFQNSQGIEAGGTLVHLSQNLVVFEVYNPYSVVQMSEVLHNLRILRGDRTIYNGRAVVSNLVSTGLMLIVSATLIDSWSELSGLMPGQGLREEMDLFVQEWEAHNRLRPSYQLAVNKIRSFFGEVSRLFEQVDTAIAADASNRSFDFRQDLLQEIEPTILPKMEELFYLFEQEASNIEPEAVVSHKAFAHREIHPLILCAPFVHRTYTKPLGYAGDYIMVQMMLGDPVKGTNTYAKMVNYLCLSQGAVKAHRNRIAMLEDILKNEANRVIEKGGTFQVISIGCGPAEEVRRLVKHHRISQQCKFYLLDFNPETINYVKKVLGDSESETDGDSRFLFIKKSIHDLLKESARKEKSFSFPNFDTVYCAGLFDYLSDRICKRLLTLFYEWLEPGGLLVATNVHPNNPIRYFMEHLVEWHLIYRNETDMKALASDFASQKVYTDSTGVNVFLEVRKPKQ